MVDAVIEHAVLICPKAEQVAALTATLIITRPWPPSPNNDSHASGRVHDVVGQSLKLSER
jgi:hypothetical protein